MELQILWETKNRKQAKRQHQNRHDYFCKVKQLTSLSWFNAIQNSKVKLRNGKWYTIRGLLTADVGYQRCMSLHSLWLYWKCSFILLSNVAGMGCCSWAWAWPQSILLVFHDIAEASFAHYWFLVVVLLGQFAWKPDLSCPQSVYVMMMS